MTKDQFSTMTMKGSSTPLINDEKVVKKFHPALMQLLGEDKVVEQMTATTASEDVYLNRRLSLYYTTQLIMKEV